MLLNFPQYPLIPISHFSDKKQFGHKNSARVFWLPLKNILPYYLALTTPGKSAKAQKGNRYYLVNSGKENYTLTSLQIIFSIQLRHFKKKMSEGYFSPPLVK